LNTADTVTIKGDWCQGRIGDMDIKIISSEYKIGSNGRLRELYREWGSKNDSPLAFRSGCYLVVAVIGREIVGACQLIVFADLAWGFKRGYIENVYVLEKHRRRGIGRAMMLKVEDLARGLGCKYISLTSNKTRVEAQAMYANLGYREGFSFSKELREG